VTSAPANVVKPADEAALAALVVEAASAGRPLELIGRGSKRALGRPIESATLVDLTGFSGIIDYAPEELVLTAGPATPLDVIEAALAAKRQMLAFEPPRLGALLGDGAGGSIGGALSCNLSGSRRIKAGAARDHFLGFRGVNGRGEVFKAGGKVVKNVTGYDLCKLIAGSYGTLAALSEITVKVLPAPEKARTVLVFGLEPMRAIAALGAGVGSPHEVSGAAYVPKQSAARSTVEYVSSAGASVAALRVEGVGPSVEARCTALRELLGRFGPVEELHSLRSKHLWKEIGEVAPLLGPLQQRVVWRVSVPPAMGGQVSLALSERIAGAETLLDWAGGLIWAALPERADAHEAAVRAIAVEAGGYATLIRAPAAIRASVPVFQPMSQAEAALSRRLKESFDPAGVFNRGRMVEGR